MSDETLRTKLRRLLRVKMELMERGEAVTDELEGEIQRVVVKLAERFANDVESESSGEDTE